MEDTLDNEADKLMISQLVRKFIIQPFSDPSRILPIPLDFESDPVQVLTKQLTSLNSGHPWRISYLGPRWPTSLAFNKKMAASTQNPFVPNPTASERQTLGRYPFAFEQTSRHSAFMDNYYRSQQFKTSVYYRAFEGVNPTLPQQDVVKFDASFQSANLDCAVKVSDEEYDLFLRVDSNTKGYTQWFYFEISSKKRRRVQLNICNLNRMKCLYQKVRQGMKPFIMSTKNYKRNRVGWQQSGNNVKFEPSKLRYGFLYERFKLKEYWTLSFEVDFQYDDDTMYVAYCVPYTYSQLLRDIKDIERECPDIVEVGSLGRSRMGLQIPLLIITNKKVSDKKKKVCMMVGRIHPGQANSSSVLQGFLRYLCSKQAQAMLQKSLFIIIPMVNPDGVVLGNSRTSVMGKDLNRLYNCDNKDLYPEIECIKQMIIQLQKVRHVYMFMDFHGHSQRKNAFMYGPEYPLSDLKYIKSKVLPKMLSQKTEMFRYYSCSFKIPQTRQSTGRAYMLYNYKIPFTYTLQCSNGSFYNSQSLINYQFNKAKWMQLGTALGQTLNEYIQYLLQYQEFIRQRRLMKASRKLKNSEQKRSSTAPKLKQSINQDEDPLAIIRNKMQTKIFFASIMEQIRIDDTKPLILAQPQLQEDVESESSVDKQQIDKTKQNELALLMINQIKIQQRKVQQEEFEIQFQRHVATERRGQPDKPKQKSNGFKRFKPKKSKKAQTSKYQQFQKEYLEQYRVNHQRQQASATVKVSRKTFDRTTPQSKRHFTLLNPPQRKSRRNTNSNSQSKLEFANPDADSSFKNTVGWNVEKQLKPDKPVVNKPIEIGSQIVFPQSVEKPKNRIGFCGSQWCNKLRKRFMRRQNVDTKGDAYSTLYLSNTKPSRMGLGRPSSSSLSINYCKLIQVASVPPQTTMVNNRKINLPSRFTIMQAFRHKRQLSAKKSKQQDRRHLDDSSDFLQVRKYQ